MERSPRQLLARYAGSFRVFIALRICVAMIHFQSRLALPTDCSGECTRGSREPSRRNRFDLANAGLSLAIPVAIGLTFASRETVLSGDAFPPAVESALRESRQLRGLVNRDRIRPRWLPGGDQFWYEVTTGRGESEFVSVDASSGRIRRSPDRDGLDLPVAEPRRTSAMTRRKRRTARTGPPLRLTFSNRLGRPVAIRWIDTDGQGRGYGTIPTGGEHEQATYEGHVWLLADEQDRTIAVFEADPADERIVIDGPGDDEAGRRRRGSRPDRESRRPADEWPSPDNRFTVRLRDHNVVVESSDGGGTYQLTDDGTAVDGYRFGVDWSPDSRTAVTTTAWTSVGGSSAD